MQEALDQPISPSIDSLRQGRQELAALLSANQLRGAFASSRIENPDVTLTEVPNENLGYDCSVLRACDYVALESLGIDTSEFAAKIVSPEKDSKSLEVIDVEDEHIIIEKLGSGMNLRFKKDGQEDKYGEFRPKYIRDIVVKRFANSPGHSELFRIKNQLRQEEQLPQEVSTVPFDPKEDPLGTLSFLEDIGLIYSQPSLARDIASGLSVNDIIDRSLKSIPDYRAETSETESTRVFKWGKSVVKTLEIDNDTGYYVFSVKQNPEANYPEIADQSPNAESLPFIETKCAEELSSLLDSTGLMFHPSFQTKMMKPGAVDRYGSIYTQLSREVAKWANNPSRTRLSKLLVPLDQEYSGNKLAEKISRDSYTTLYDYDNKVTSSEDDIEERVRELWLGAKSQVKGESAKVLINMINDSLNRTSQPSSSLPVTKEEVKIRDGACFDVTSYYIGAASNDLDPNGLRKVTVNGVGFLEKSHGSHTFLTTEATVFNGVRLPKGSLFAKNGDGWAFLRITVFAFDNPEDQIASSGSEMAKTLLNEREAIINIGGTSLAHLATAAR